jgi:hypothetical protein
MTEGNNRFRQDNLIQITAARPEGWPIREIAKRIILVFLGLVATISVAYFALGGFGGLFPPQCCEYTCNQSYCTFYVNGQSVPVSCANPPCHFGYDSNNSLKECPIVGSTQAGEDICAVGGGCYYPAGSNTRWYITSWSGICRQCT